MTKRLKIGLIGTDSSHAIAFARLLNVPSDPFHVAGGEVMLSCPGGSPDFALSASRVEEYMELLRTQYGVARADTPEEVAQYCDAVLLTAADGRAHRELFARIAPYGKPVFIDKPLALSYREASEIRRISEERNVPVMSCSALRYAEYLVRELEQRERADIAGADVYGPMPIEPTQSYYFWYGIHTAEMLFALMGPGCVQCSVVSAREHEFITGLWRDGRIGTIRGSRCGIGRFGALAHRADASVSIDIGAGRKPFYASMLERVMSMFRTGEPQLGWNEMLETVRFLEAAEASRLRGTAVSLAEVD
ncbi:hypothetical protein PAE9249_01708 [Paenibacillus sp. CECT 9249]|uniref:Gfo/Idh/MocA family protein n=1 Tax=Paenibacillus sp. CECT 9249 TaxID=2845385 RepID=UPI001E3AAF1A|nr:Gfo/Idh/MocA family oxidoreductase [Paenibacillus sp. CECT 9249]CAH0119209.1 hypothetical protein PAE9249_01708 [Paenibacillus sp. CECT 9249]